MGANERALSRQVVESRMGQYSAGAALREALQEVEKTGNMLLPVSRVGAIPPGYAVTLSAVMVDPATETYKQRNGGLSLHKVALDRIAGAAGVRFVPEGFKRLDDGSHPYVYECQVVAEVVDMDGTRRMADGVKRLDLRGSGTEDDPYTAMALEVLGKDNDFGNLRRTRAFIAEHAQSKARNRAIRALLGIRQSYAPADFERPFVAAKMVYTGRTGDPATDRLLAIMAASKELGGFRELSAALGQALVSPLAMQPPADLDAPALEASTPPAALDMDDDDEPVITPPPQAVPPATPTTAPQAAPQAPTPDLEEIIELARRKGRVAKDGTEPAAAKAAGKLTVEQIRRMDAATLADMRGRLNAMPDESWLPSDDEMPDWMKGGKG